MSLAAFWAVIFFSAFAAFTVISVLIAVKGIGEIRVLFGHLEQRASSRAAKDAPRAERPADRER